MDGIIVVNKEQDYTSFDVVAKLRGILKQKKMGHTGTLDPMATGVLPVCLGAGTKLCDMMTDSKKIYRVEMLLGKDFGTEDVTGELLAEADVTVSDDEIKECVSEFTGELMQLPPMYSAVKVNGKKLCDYARAGKEVERKPRKVTIYEIEIESICLPVVTMKVTCSKGTYIRSLCRDVGQKLGTGAVMTGLVREKSAGFTLSDSRSLKELEQLKEEGRLNEAVLPMDSLLSGFPALDISPEGEKRLRNGNPLLKEDVGTDELSDGQIYRIYLSGQLAALYSWDENKKQLRNKKMLTDFI